MKKGGLFDLTLIHLLSIAAMINAVDSVSI